MPRKYKFEVIVEEGCDEFWESLDKKGVSGCDDIKTEIEMCLDSLSPDVTLVEYRNEE